MTNPAFLFFDKQFAYESLGLPLTMFLLWIEARRQQAPLRGRYELTVGAVGGTAAWLLNVARVTISYLGGNLLTTLQEILSLIAGETVIRRLFHGLAGDVAPLWERLVGYGAVMGIMALLPVGLWAVWRRYRHRPLAVTLALGALMYPVSQVLRFTPFGLQISGRMPEFVFLPLGFVLAVALIDPDNGVAGLWRLVGARFKGIGSPSRAMVVRRVLFIVWILMLFGGGIILGWPRWARMPGPYLVVADSRSIEAQGLTAARRAGAYLAPSERIVADRVNALLMLAYGQMDPVTSSYDGVPVSKLFFAERPGPRERAVIREGEVRYIVIDRRIATGRPLAGVYFEPGERPPDEITVPVGVPLLMELEALPGARRILDSGDIIIYDLGGMDDTD
ncbi:MAG: hypothetical protein ACOX9A_00970 [Anaerolineae bacterium]|jgi:hypothetical protein